MERGLLSIINPVIGNDKARRKVIAVSAAVVVYLPGIYTFLPEERVQAYYSGNNGRSMKTTLYLIEEERAED